MLKKLGDKQLNLVISMGKNIKNVIIISNNDADKEMVISSISACGKFVK